MRARLTSMRLNPKIAKIAISVVGVCLFWPYISGFAAVGYGYAWWALSPGPAVLNLEAPRNDTLVPKIMHQTWKTTNVPPHWQAAQQSCRALHPDYEYRLWTDQEATEFIAREFPWFLPTYLSYPYQIQRVDVVRYFILYHYGGIYLDLDVGCNARLDGMRAASFVAPLTMPVGISNDVMAAAPGSPFLERCIHRLRGWNLWMLVKYVQVMFSTGPMFLTIQVPLAERLADIAVLSRADYGKYSESAGALFYHLHGSSWHAGDAPFFLFMYRFGRLVGVAALVVAVAAVALVLTGRLRCRPLTHMGKQNDDYAGPCKLLALKIVEGASHQKSLSVGVGDVTELRQKSATMLMNDADALIRQKLTSTKPCNMV